MADTLSPEERSTRMGLVKAKNTRPELVVRSIVHRLGYRYRLHSKDLPGRPDLVFKSRKKVIFVNGCFWHRHEAPQCRLCRLPKSRVDFWSAKFGKTVERDRQVARDLREAGWQALIVWECELRNPDVLARRIREFMGE